MPPEATSPPPASMSRTLFSLAGFQVITIGRFWVIAEASDAIDAFEVDKANHGTGSPPHLHEAALNDVGGAHLALAYVAGDSTQNPGHGGHECKRDFSSLSY
jgi:hypothetical protein